MNGYRDCKDTFELCDELGVEPTIKIRENALDKGLDSRAEEVRLYQSLGYKEWAEQKGYGMR